MLNLRKQAIRYACFGVLCASTDWLFFCFELNVLKMDSLLANFISSHLGIFLSYYLNSRYTFNAKGGVIYRFLSFYLVGLVGYIFAHFFLKVGLETTSFRPEIIKGVSYIGIFIIQFTLNKVITFGGGWKAFRLFLLKYLNKNNMLGLEFDLGREGGGLK